MSRHWAHPGGVQCQSHPPPHLSPGCCHRLAARPAAGCLPAAAARRAPVPASAPLPPPPPPPPAAVGGPPHSAARCSMAWKRWPDTKDNPVSGPASGAGRLGGAPRSWARRWQPSALTRSGCSTETHRMQRARLMGASHGITRHARAASPLSPPRCFATPYASLASFALYNAKVLTRQGQKACGKHALCRCASVWAGQACAKHVRRHVHAMLMCAPGASHPAAPAEG